MAAFSLARRLAAGETVFSGWCMMGSPIVAETIAREGFPAVVLDAQHGLWDVSSLIAGIGGVHHAGASPFVRVPLDDAALSSRALDFGAEGILAPMINEAPDGNAATDISCAAAIGAGKFPGIYCRDAQRALDMSKRCFRFMTVGSDFSLVREGSAAALKMLPIKAKGARDAF